MRGESFCCTGGSIFFRFVMPFSGFVWRTEEFGHLESDFTEFSYFYGEIG